MWVNTITLLPYIEHFWYYKSMNLVYVVPSRRVPEQNVTNKRYDYAGLFTYNQVWYEALRIYEEVYGEVIIGGS